MPYFSRVSPRRQDYDYTSSGAYFVTICTKDRVHYFWEIVDGQMILNTLWTYCYDEMYLLSENRRTIDIHSYIIMPNHVHILLMISDFHDDMNTGYRRDDLAGRPHNIGHATSVSLPIDIVRRNDYVWPSLWSIINVFKWTVTKYAKANDITFGRQPRYHDHIIRNTAEYDNICRYIKNNPQKWGEDRFNNDW